MNSNVIASEKLQETLSKDLNDNAASRMDKLIVDYKNWSPFQPKNFNGNSGPGWGCAITIDNHFVFFSGTSGSICCWDLISGQKEVELKKHQNTPNFLFLIKNDSVLISVGWDGKVYFWNWRESSCIGEVHTGSSGLYSALLNSDESILVIGSASRDLIFIDVGSMTESKRLSTDGCAFGLGINSTNTELVTGSQNEKIEIFSMSSKESLSKTAVTTGPILCLEVSKDDKYFFLGTRTNLIKIFSYAEKKELHSFTSHSNWVRKLLTIDHYLISCSSDKLVKVFDINTKTELMTIEGSEGFINGMCLSKDNQYLLTCSSDGALKVFKIGTLNRLVTSISPSPIVALVFTHSEKAMLTGSGDGVLRIYDTSSMQLQKQLKVHTGEIRKIRISNDDKLAASCGLDFKVILWDLVQAESLNVFTKHTAKVHGLDFTPNYKLIASAGEDFYINVWNTSTFELVYEVIAHSDSIFELSFQSDNETLISTGADKTLRVWNVASKESLFKFETRTPIIDSGALSPDQKFYAYGARDSVIHLWDWDRKEEITTFKVGTGFINSLKFLPDSKHLVSGSGDFIIRIWNCIEQRLETSLYGNIAIVKGIAVTSDMKKIYSGCFKKTIRMWDIGNISQLEIVEISSVFDSYIFLAALKNKQLPPKHLVHSHFSPLKINLVHYYCYMGLKKPLYKALKEGVQIIIDDDLKSPLHYAITRKSQGCIDAILAYMIQLRKTNLKLFLNYGNALRDDFAILLENASMFLEDFLNVLYYKAPGTIKFGVPVVSLPSLLYTQSKWIDTTQFVKEGDVNSSAQESIIEFKTLPFAIFNIKGSRGSIDILDSITSTQNSRILRTEVVKTFIRDKFEKIWYFILFLTLLDWTSLCVLVGLVFLSNEGKQGTNQFYILSGIYFVINILNSLYEFVQTLATGWNYFIDIWNLIDICKVIVSFTWIVFENGEFSHPENFEILTWIMIALNFLRGLTGFRTFDRTRHYTKLIVRSIFESIYFLIIFFYSTLTFGVLYYSTKFGDPIRFSIWKTPYELNNGSFENSSEFTLQYFTFFLASIVNVIIILNLLISILGDSFDSFQNEAVEIDCLEMAEIVLEIETLMFWRRKHNHKHFMYRCQVVEQVEKNNWEGKLNAISNMVEEIKDKFEEEFGEVRKQNTQAIEKLDKEFLQIQKQNTEILQKLSEIQNKA